MKKRSKIIAAAFLIFLCGATMLVVNKRMSKDKDDIYILHALGGMDGEKSYINSLDCLKVAYDKGYRLFEVDVSFTSDDVLVLAHSGENNEWSENDWKQRLGQDYPFGDGKEIPQGYDKEKHLATYEDFKSFRIQGKYESSSFSDLIRFMKTHDDIVVMVDAGNRTYEDTLILYKEIFRVADGRTDILDRLIAGGQNTEMVRAAREVYDFPLINLYYATDDKREEIISTPEKFVAFCKENNIQSFSVAKEVYTEDVAKRLESEGLKSYVFTVNDIDEEKLLREYGADIIGTDYLWESDEAE